MLGDHLLELLKITSPYKYKPHNHKITDREQIQKIFQNGFNMEPTSIPTIMKHPSKKDGKSAGLRFSLLEHVCGGRVPPPYTSPPWVLQSSPRAVGLKIDGTAYSEASDGKWLPRGFQLNLSYNSTSLKQTGT